MSAFNNDARALVSETSATADGRQRGAMHHHLCVRNGADPHSMHPMDSCHGSPRSDHRKMSRKQEQNPAVGWALVASGSRRRRCCHCAMRTGLAWSSAHWWRMRGGMKCTSCALPLSRAPSQRVLAVHAAHCCLVAQIPSSITLVCLGTARLLLLRNTSTNSRVIARRSML